MNTCHIELSEIGIPDRLLNNHVRKLFQVRVAGLKDICTLRDVCTNYFAL
jgi:hypothetical protein